jgi:amino acid transporter
LPLARQLNLFDITMLVMGGIIGSGIFINPYVVARQVPVEAAILGVWIFGGAGGRLVAAAIAISTLGFLSQSMLTAPRIYYAMARDGVFFKSIGMLYERTQAPAAAILLQAVLAAAIRRRMV